MQNCNTDLREEEEDARAPKKDRNILRDVYKLNKTSLRIGQSIKKQQTLALSPTRNLYEKLDVERELALSN